MNRKAMVIELTRAGLIVEEEKSLKVYYDEGEELGVLLADLLVEGTVVVELKSQKHIVKKNEAQLDLVNPVQKNSLIKIRIHSFYDEF